MTDIIKTKWYARLKKDFESGNIMEGTFNESLAVASQPNLKVNIHQTDETGEKVWAIAVDSFWLDAVKTKKKAIALCKEAGWIVI